jgi:hypothetical protein
MANFTLVENPKFSTNGKCIAAGLPGKLERLVKYHSSEPMVNAREVAQLGQGSVDSEESGIALTPILFALGALTVAWRYIARA